MNLNRFQTILDAYGANPEYWPEGEREAAQRLARSSLPAARALNHARALDSALRTSTFPNIAQEDGRLSFLHSSIVNAARPRSRTWFERWFGFDLDPSQLWPSVAGLALATILGFAVGLGGLMQADTDRDSDDISVLSPIDLTALGQ